MATGFLVLKYRKQKCLKKYATPSTFGTFEGMMPSTISRIQKKNQTCYTQSTVLIPEQFLFHYKQNCLKHGSRKSYFKFLLQTYIPHLPAYSKTIQDYQKNKWKTQYQNNHQHLNPKNFIPDPEDWEDLRHAASGLGVSMCFLFVFLMKIEIGNFAKNRDCITSWVKACWNSVRFIVAGVFVLGDFSRCERFMRRRNPELYRKQKVKRKRSKKRE